MKRFLVLLAVLFLSFHSFAQDSTFQVKGKIGVGGSLGYYESDGNVTNKTLTGSSQFFQVLPSVSYFMTNDILVGMGLGYQEERSPILLNVYSSSMFFVSPMVQKLYPLGSKRFGVFTKLQFIFGSGTQSRYDYSDFGIGVRKYDLTTYSGAIGAGLYFFPSRSFMLSASLGNVLRLTHDVARRGGNTEKGWAVELLNLSTEGGGLPGLQFGGTFLFR